MKRWICLGLAGMLLASCTTTAGTAGASRARAKAGAGAILGGLAGAATAILRGKEGDEVLAAAAAGAVAGALAGYAIGQAQDRRLASRDDAVQRFAYDPRRGHLLDLESVELSPPTIAAGSTAQIRMVYTVLSPGQFDTIPIAYVTSLYQGGERVVDLGRQTTTVADGGGTLEVTFPFTVPSQAPGGTYELRTEVAVSGSQLTEAASRSFYIGT